LQVRVTETPEDVVKGEQDERTMGGTEARGIKKGNEKGAKRESSQKGTAENS